MFAKTHIIWLSLCLSMVSSRRTEFINEKSFLCVHQFEDNYEFSMASYDKAENEYFVGSKEILYEIDGTSLDHSTSITYKKLFNINSTNHFKFDLKVLQMVNTDDVMVCGIIYTGSEKKGKCFKVSNNIKHPNTSPPKIDIPLPNNVSFSYNKNELHIINYPKPVSLFTYDTRDLKLLRNKTLSEEGWVTATFKHDSSTYFVLNQAKSKAQLLRIKPGSSDLRKVEMECKSKGMKLEYLEMLSKAEGALFAIFKEKSGSDRYVMCYFENEKLENIFNQVPDNNEEVYKVTAQESLVLKSEPESILAQKKIKGKKVKTYVIFVARQGSMIKYKSDLTYGKMTQYTDTNFSRPLDIKHLSFDKHHDLFALGNKFVCKVQSAMCLYNTCADCIDDPHCGWCISTKKPACKLEGYCKNGKDLWKYENCPVVSITPNISTFENFSTQKFLFKTENVVTDFDTINCSLSDRLKYSLQNVTAKRDSISYDKQNFVCSSFSYNISSHSHDYDTAPMEVNVTIILNDMQWGTNLVSLYQCSHSNSCFSCMSLKFPCNWCVWSHQCQDSNLPCSSVIQGETLKINSSSKCPSAKSGSGKTGKAEEVGKVFSSGSNIAYTIQTENLFYFEKMRCQFNGVGFKEFEVDAKIHPQRTSVECKSALFKYLEAMNETRVNVNLLTKDDNVIDQSTPLYFTLYKCEKMASFCGACSLLPPKRQCVWCQKGSKGSCVLKDNNDNCQISTQCTNPHIFKIEPNGGPVKGNTLLTIHGDGLGKTVDDVEVFVGNKLCPLVRQSYSESLKVTCRTPDWTSARYVPVLVRTHNQYNITSPTKYQYAETTVTKCKTMSGIEAGGRVVVLTGKHLDLASPPKVFFGAKQAELISRNETVMKVKAPPGTGKQNVNVEVKVEGEEKKKIGKFSYLENPKNISFQPNISFQSGGRNVIVKGQELGVVSNATLFITANNTNFSSPSCVRKNDNFECITPKVDFTESINNLDHNIYQVFFTFDNYLYHYDSMKDRMEIYPDPTFLTIYRPFLTSQETITFQMTGDSRCVSKMEEDIEVLIGGVKCNEAVKCNPDNMSFTLPLENCPNEPDWNDVVVRIKRFKAKVGQVKFKETSNAMIVGVVLGVISCLLVLLLIFLFIFFKRKYANNKPQSTPANRPPALSTVNQTSLAKENPYNVAPGSGGQSPLGQDYLNPTAFINDEAYLNAMLDRLDNNSIRQAAKQVYIARDRLELGNQLGKGHFGKVHAATLRDVDLKNPRLVAVKTIDDPDLDQKMVEGFLKEGVIMKNFDHPHVLNLIGLCVGYQKEPMVVLPFMANGDLRSYVKDKKRSFTARQLLKLAQQVSEGMSYLASLNFIHRDLAARNCMIDDKSQVKVADFGLSHELHDSEYYSSKNRKAKLPIKWMALESLENYVFTTKSDVWSFGVLMWELMTRGVTPYPDVDVFETRNYLNTGRRLYKPKFCPDNVFNIMTDCWQELPERRPTFTDLVNRIEVLLNPPKKQTSTSPTSSPNTTYVNIKHPVDYQDYLKPNVDSEAVVAEGGSSGGGRGGGGDGGCGDDGEESNGSSDEGNNISKGLLSVRRKKGGDKVV